MCDCLVLDEQPTARAKRATSHCVETVVPSAPYRTASLAHRAVGELAFAQLLVDVERRIVQAVRWVAAHKPVPHDVDIGPLAPKQPGSVLCEGSEGLFAATIESET